MVHVVFMHHGLWGNHSHLDYIAKKLEHKYKEDLIIGLIDKNSGLHTYDGIDVLGDESVRWVENFLFDKPDVTEVSFIGYSLGGLVMRYTVGKLYHKKFFDKYTPVNFITFASPHLGASKLPNKIFNHLFNFFSGNIALRTGKQIALLDHFLNGLPLLVIMSNPNYCFFQALELFKRRALFTNVLNDRMITYTSGSISVSIENVATNSFNVE
ncbi:hypothetical protein HK099_004862 [Clydaea vesicula]|uniref:DUF676 domain-containing protein n=1 Tax=Clydaea vesicula TaxID=447962 RepID=A0AAD5TZP9_9FUNG|nr:hypothetical protein HK099_004862 [Clydaea vesicula]